MALFRQIQSTRIGVARRDPSVLGQRIFGRKREQETIAEQGQRFKRRRLDRRRQEHGIKGAANELLQQHPDLGFLQIQAQSPKASGLGRQDARSHVKRERRDHTEPPRAGQKPVCAPGAVGKVTDGTENV
jgi:hypothetical protein